jgi:hypothetical protein
MLTLTLNSVAIPIPPDFSMQLTWKSPMCDFEKIPSGYGLGISLPINEHTRALFGNPERFAKYRSGADQKFPGFEVRFSGVLLMAGSLKITNCSAGKYEATLIDQLGVLGEKEAERNILEIPEFAEELAWTNKAAYDPDTDDFCCFPVRNPDFFKEKGIKVPTTNAGNPETEVEVLRYIFNHGQRSKVNNLDIDNTISEDEVIISPVNNAVDTTFDAQTLSVVSPFFFLDKLIRSTLKDRFFYITDNALASDNDLKLLCLYNNFDITKMVFGVNEPYTFISGVEFLDIEGVSPYDQVFVRNISNYTRSYPEGLKIVPKNHLPKMKTGELLLSTQNYLNMAFHFRPDNTVSVISRDAVITGESFDLEQYFSGTWAIGEQKNVAINLQWSHDDNDLQFGERFTNLDDRRTDIGIPVDDWEDLAAIAAPQEGEIRFVKNFGVYAEYGWKTIDDALDETLKATSRDVLGWSEVSIAYQNGWYEYGREEVEEIKTAWSTLAGNYDDPVFENIDRILTVRQPGNMNLWKARQQAFSPRLMLYHPDDNTGYNENANLSLKWDKPAKGIMTKYWSNWLPFWANRLPVTGSFDVPVNVLRYLIWNICRKYRTREGEFLIEEMSCEIGVDKIGTVEIKGFKV